MLVLVVGAFGGFWLFHFLVFGKPIVHSGFAPVLFFGMTAGGGYLAQLAFSHLFPAACPACRARSAVPALREPMLYVCRSCGAAKDGLVSFSNDMLVSIPSPEQGRKSESWGLWVFLLLGLGAVGVAVFLARDSIEFFRHGVSTEARVMRVTAQLVPGHKATDDPTTQYIALIEYRVGKTPFTINRTWSIKQGGSCLWPCYDEGQALKVLYLPEAPHRAKVDTLAELFFAPLLVGGVGSLFSVFAILMMLRRRRRLPR